MLVGPTARPKKFLRKVTGFREAAFFLIKKELAMQKGGVERLEPFLVGCIGRPGVLSIAVPSRGSWAIGREFLDRRMSVPKRRAAVCSGLQFGGAAVLFVASNSPASRRFGAGSIGLMAPHGVLRLLSIPLWGAPHQLIVCGLPSADGPVDALEFGF